MKIFVLGLLFAISLLNISCNSKNGNEKESKYDEIITKYTEIKQIISSEVDDTFYVYIRLPKHYETSNKRYPVLYLLDGDIAFNMATSVIRYLQFGKDVPDLIIVAPGYGTLLNDKETNFRERDYTFSENKRFEVSGGGNNYLHFFKKELIPLIDSRYRTNSQRILNGYSLGGLFTIHTLLSSPNTFNSYIAGSPYIRNDLDLLLEKADMLSKTELNKKLFVSVGELEDTSEYHIPINSLLSEIKKSHGIETLFSEIENGTHYSCPPEALTYGLKFLFNQPTTVEP
jgi:predicted alpha/beta superfamily hydrolase